MAKKAVERKPGRPTLYRDEYVGRVYTLALVGATDAELAEEFGVSESCLNNWKLAHPPFMESLKAGKLQADTHVADRLHQRALGFEFDEAQPIKLKEVLYENGKRVKETERVEIVMVHRVVPPDTTAGIFWLKNRRPVQWRDKQDVQHGGEVRHSVVLLPPIAT